MHINMSLKQELNHYFLAFLTGPPLQLFHTASDGELNGGLAGNMQAYYFLLFICIHIPNMQLQILE